MNSPILSQDEIEALLHRGNPKAYSEELEALLKLVAQSIAMESSGGSLELVDIEGPRVGDLAPSLKRCSLEESIVLAADIGEVQILMFMSLLDAMDLGEMSARPDRKAFLNLGQAWVKEMAQMMDSPYQTFQVQSLGIGALTQLDLESPSYLVCHSLEGNSRGLEFHVVITNADGFEKRAGEAMAQMRREHATMSAKGRLLKGSKSPVTRAVFTPIDESLELEGEQGMNLLEDIDLTVTVELGHTTLTLNEILELRAQSVIRLERHAGEAVDVFINNTRAAKAEVVVLEDNFGVRILEIVPKSQRISGE